MKKSNIGWARMLEHAGVHVVYGVAGFKDALQNYHGCPAGGRRHSPLHPPLHRKHNAVTSLIYEDMACSRCDEAIGKDARPDQFSDRLFTNQDYQKITRAPLKLRQKLETLIRREIELQMPPKSTLDLQGRIPIVDPDLIRMLYQASQAGVKWTCWYAAFVVYRLASKA